MCVGRFSTEDVGENGRRHTRGANTINTIIVFVVVVIVKSTDECNSATRKTRRYDSARGRLQWSEQCRPCRRGCKSPAAAGKGPRRTDRVVRLSKSPDESGDRDASGGDERKISGYERTNDPTAVDADDRTGKKIKKKRKTISAIFVVKQTCLRRP